MLRRAYALFALVVGALGCHPDEAPRGGASATASASASATASAAAAPSGSASFAPLADLPAGPAAVPAAQADTLVGHGSLRLELLEAGGAPRQPLRTSLRPGRTERAQLTVEVT